MDQDFRRQTTRRDYTRETIDSSRSPGPPRLTQDISEKLDHSPIKALRSRRRSKIVLVNIFRLIILGALVFGAYFSWKHFNHKRPQDPDLSNLAGHIVPIASIANSATFPVYYPDPMPTGFRQGGQSVYTNSIVILEFVHNNKIINVTEQSIPKAIKIPPNPQKINLKVGAGWLTNIYGQATGLISTPKTLVTITSTSELSNSALIQFLQSFQLVK